MTPVNPAQGNYGDMGEMSFEELNGLQSQLGDLARSPTASQGDRRLALELKQELKEVNEYINLLDTDASSIFQSFKSITEEIGNNNKAYSSASKSLSSLTSISGQLRDHQSDINKLSSKQLSSLKSKISSKT